MRAIKIERVEHAEEIGGDIGHRERGRGSGGPAVAAEVVGEHSPPGRKPLHHQRPHAPISPSA